MKLYEITEPSYKVIQEFCEKWGISDWTHFIGTDGKPKKTFQSSIALYSSKNNEVLDPPMSLSWWGSLRLGTVEVFSDAGFGNALIKRWDNFPPGKYIQLADRVVIESFSGIEKQIYTEKIEIGEDQNMPKGLLRLLKMQSMKELKVHGDSDNQLVRAAEILNKHLEGDKNIIECQAELIDADLEEYAKL